MFEDDFPFPKKGYVNSLEGTHRNTSCFSNEVHVKSMDRASRLPMGTGGWAKRLRRMDMLGLSPSSPCDLHHPYIEEMTEIPLDAIFCCKTTPHDYAAATPLPIHPSFFWLQNTKKHGNPVFEDPPKPAAFCFPNEGSFLQLPGKSPDNDALHADVAPELIPAAQNVSSQVGDVGKEEVWLSWLSWLVMLYLFFC